MRVLWITNVLFPEASAYLSGSPVLKSSGGWVLGAASAMLDASDISLAVATVSNKVKELVRVEGEKITYFILPLGKGNITYNKNYESFWKTIKESFRPEIIHIYGTEFSHGLAWVNANGADNVIVSIQGLTSVIKDYYYSGLSISQILRMEFYGVLNLLQKSGWSKYSIQGKNEELLINKVHDVIGRTSWDRAHVWAINPKVNYHFCNETLRPEFYQGRWIFDNCRKHTIFVSQVGKTIKGLHQLIKAMPLVLNEYPDAKVIVAGDSIYKTSFLSSFKNRYCIIARRMLRDYKVEDVFDFIGPQDEQGMKKYMLSSNVYVLSSSIENSPNTLGEAQLLGLPCVASFVGGVPDMVESSCCGIMYRFSDYQMLAYGICNAFKMSSTFDNSEMRRVARERHNPQKNTERIFDIYREIFK